MKIVPYFPLAPNVLRLIVRLKLNKIAKRMMENRKVIFEYDEELVDTIANRCTEVDSGARNVDHILSDTLMPEMSRELLSRMAVGENLEKVKVSVDGDGFVFTVE